MGSQSDWPTMENSANILRKFGVSFEAKIVSAHRTPDLLFEYAKTVLGVPVKSKCLKGIDSLLSIVQMPAGIPTATFAIGEAGATNAALFAISMLAANGNEILAEKLKIFRAEQRQKIESAELPPS